MVVYLSVVIHAAQLCVCLLVSVTVCLCVCVWVEGGITYIQAYNTVYSIPVYQLNGILIKSRGKQYHSITKQSEHRERRVMQKPPPPSTKMWYCFSLMEDIPGKCDVALNTKRREVPAI